MFSVANLVVFSLFIISTHGGVTMHNPFYCYSEDPIRAWTGLGGVLSTYEPLRGQSINANVSTCTPSKFWMLGRHGARYPSANDVPVLFRVISTIHSQILTNYNQGKTSLCASDYELLKNWKFNSNVTIENADDLSESGWIELEAQAKRLQAAFPTILPSTYSPKDYFFRSSDSQRTRYSLYAFADGLFGVNGHEQVIIESDIPDEDLYMRSFALCTNYTDIPVGVESNMFIDGPEYQEMVRQVSARLGFHNSNILRNSEIALFAQYCKYEQTWNLNYTDPSPFCAAFSVANAQVIEYSQDINWYHRIGYGRPEYRRLYLNVMCFLLQDMLRFIQSNDVNDHKARIFNGFASQFLILLHFDAFDGDDPLTWHNFAQQSQRVWRSTDFFPMTANLAVIRYDCADDDNDLLFLFNEKPLQIPGCNSNGVCKQSLILERLGRYLNVNCEDIYCRNDW